jgi:hypothetical protein
LEALEAEIESFAATSMAAGATKEFLASLSKGERRFVHRVAQRPPHRLVSKSYGNEADGTRRVVIRHRSHPSQANPLLRHDKAEARAVDSVPEVRLLRALGNAGAKRKGNSALHLAAKFCTAESAGVAWLLCAANAGDPAARNESGDSALHLAAANFAGEDREASAHKELRRWISHDRMAHHMARPTAWLVEPHEAAPLLSYLLRHAVVRRHASGLATDGSWLAGLLSTRVLGYNCLSYAAESGCLANAELLLRFRQRDGQCNHALLAQLDGALPGPPACLCNES